MEKYISKVYLGSMSRDVHGCPHWLRTPTPPPPTSGLILAHSFHHPPTSEPRLLGRRLWARARYLEKATRFLTRPASFSVRPRYTSASSGPHISFLSHVPDALILIYIFLFNSICWWNVWLTLCVGEVVAMLVAAISFAKTEVRALWRLYIMEKQGCEIRWSAQTS